MARQQLPMRIEAGLLARVDARADELGQTRTKFIERALELALARPAALEAEGGGSRPEQSSTRLLADGLSRTQAIRRATQK